MFEFALWGFELSISQDLLAGLFWLGLVAAAFFTRHLWNRSALYDRAEEFDQVVIHDDLLTAIADPLVFETYKTEVQKVCLHMQQLLGFCLVTVRRQFTSCIPQTWSHQSTCCHIATDLIIFLYPHYSCSILHDLLYISENQFNLEIK